MADLIGLLLEDLQSDQRTVRVDALRQLIDLDFELEICKRLEDITNNPDEDPEIQFLARQAVHSFHRKNQTARHVFPTFHSPDDLEAKFFALTFADFQQAAVDCPREAIPSLMQVFRKRLPNEDKMARVATMLCAFRRWGKTDDVDLLIPYLDSSDPLLVIEVIGACERLAPARLAKALPKLLVSPESAIQVRALRAVLKLDFQKGFDLLRAMFAAENPGARAAAFLQCMTVAFPKVKELVFNALALEEDMRVLVRATNLLVLNPEESTVRWLMDISIDAPKEKADWCLATIDQVLEAIKLSGVMEGTTVAEFAAKIRAEIEKRRRNTVFGALLEELDNPDAMRRYEAIEALRDQLKFPEVQEKFQQMFLEDKDDHVKGLLTSIFAQNPDRERLQRELAIGPFQKLSRDDQLRLLGQVKSPIEFSFVRELLHPLVKAHLDAVVQAEATRLIGRFGDAKGELSSLLIALKNPEHLVQSRAIEGLGRVSPESLMKELPRLIRSNEPTVRTAALKVFFRQDKAKALQQLGEMLKSDSSVIKDQALVCLAQLNYAATRQLLLDFVQSEGNMALVKKAGVILRTNPDLDAITFVYTSMSKAVANRRQILNDILKECVVAASEAGITQLSPEDFLAKLTAGELLEG